MTDYAVVYLSSIDWEFRRQDHQFICLELAARGKRVVYVENTGIRFPAPRDAGRVLSRLRNFARSSTGRRPRTPDLLDVVSPLAVPAAGTGAGGALNAALLKSQLGGRLRRLGTSRKILWVGIPNQAALDLADWIRPTLIVYYCGDLFSEIPGARRSIRDSELALLKRADVVFANSQALVAHCRSAGADPILVPIGIDLAVSADARAGRLPVPPELRKISGRAIGYMGSLSHKVDRPLLEAVARAFPSDTVVVLGSVEDERYRPRVPNLLILGDRPYDKIGAYLSRFSVGLIPYVINAFTESVYPGKLVEYLAHALPVVSTPLPEVTAYREIVTIAASPEDFVAAVGDALAREQEPLARAQRVSWAERNSYERIVAEMIGVVESRLEIR